MGKGIQVGNIILGEGIPKICVPVTGGTVEELLTQAAQVRGTKADLVEWRVDYFAGMEDIPAVEAALYRLREALGKLPLLFTVRSAGEGGQREISPRAYLALCQAAIASRRVELVDVELFSGEGICREIIGVARENGVAVVCSSHDFAATPTAEELTDRLERMHSLGADLPKLAVMPQTSADVLTLLAATDAFLRRHPDSPVIAIAMGWLGSVSRVAGEIFGSALTFGTVAEATAPGQLTVEELYTILRILHRKEEG